VDATTKRFRWFYSFFITNIPNGGTAPLIPLFVVVALSGNVVQVGLVTAATSIASIPAYIIWGNLSDHLHLRKLFVIEGFAGLAISMFVMALSLNFATFFAANFILGLLYTASAPAGTALLIEQTPRGMWPSLIGKFSKLGGAGYLSGLLLGAAWFALLPSNATYMRIFFALVGIIAFAGTVLASLLISEERAGEMKHRIHHHRNAIADIPLRVNERAKYLPSRISSFIRLSTPSHDERQELGRRMWFYFLVTILITTGFTGFYVVFPNYLVDFLGRRFHLTESYVFIIYIASSVSSTLTYGSVSRFSGRIGEKWLQILACSSRVVLIPLFFLIPLFLATGIEVLAAMIILNSAMGFCWAIISVTGQAIVAGMAGPHTRGEAIGLYNSSMGAGSILGSLLAGLVTEISGYMSDFLFSSISIASGIIFLSVLHIEGIRAREGKSSGTGKSRTDGALKSLAKND
jgi:MFS family permease